MATLLHLSFFSFIFAVHPPFENAFVLIVHVFLLIDFFLMLNILSLWPVREVTNQIQNLTLYHSMIPDNQDVRCQCYNYVLELFMRMSWFVVNAHRFII